MNKNYYIDAIMGDWAHDKKGSNKANICYSRSKALTLHKDYAMTYTDPTDYKEYKVHGEVILTEKKLIDMKTSAVSFFRGIELTPTTIKEAVIK